MIYHPSHLSLYGVLLSLLSGIPKLRFCSYIYQHGNILTLDKNQVLLSSGLQALREFYSLAVRICPTHKWFLKSVKYCSTCIWAREVSQSDLEGNQTMRKNPFPDQVEMHFLMGKSLHTCSKEWGRGKWTQRNFICLPCSSFVSSLASSSKLHHPLCADTSSSRPDEAEPKKRFLLTGPKWKARLGWLKEVLGCFTWRGICHCLQSCLRNIVWMPKFPESRVSPAGLECPERVLHREHCLPASSSVCQSIPVWICEGGLVPRQSFP